MRFLWIYIVLGLLMFARCAQEGILSGGSKDVTPPQVLSLDTSGRLKAEFPPNGSTNFNQEEILIQFDEFIELKDKSKQIIVSPKPSSPFEYEVKGRKLFITVPLDLQANTTFIINFGESIRDITEGNILRNYQYVFSTGDYVDSLSYQVQVNNAETGAPLRQAAVMLYQEYDDSICFKEKPYYFGYTDDNGACKLSYLADDEYKLVVVKDENSNLLYDLDEEIAYEANLIHPDTSNLIDTLLSFNGSKLEIKSAKITKNGQGLVLFNRPLFTEDYTTIESVAWLSQVEKSNSLDTLSFWIKPEIEDNPKYKLKIDNLKENLFLKVPSDTLLKMIDNNANKILDNRLRIQFAQPIESFDSSEIKVFRDDKVIESFSSLSLDQKQILSIKADFELDKDYRMVLPAKNVTSIYGAKNDSIEIYFQKSEPNDFGGVSIDVQGSGEQYLLQMTDAGAVVRQVVLNVDNGFKHNWQYVTPKKYNFRLVFDVNKNGVWDTGDYLKGVQPEKVIYYNEPVELRKGWDQEITWIIK